MHAFNSRLIEWPPRYRAEVQGKEDNDGEGEEPADECNEAHIPSVLGSVAKMVQQSTHNPNQHEGACNQRKRRHCPSVNDNMKKWGGRKVAFNGEQMRWTEREKEECGELSIEMLLLSFSCIFCSS